MSRERYLDYKGRAEAAMEGRGVHGDRLIQVAIAYGLLALCELGESEKAEPAILPVPVRKKAVVKRKR